MKKIILIILKSLLAVLLAIIFVITLYFTCNLIRCTGKNQCGVIGNKVSTHAISFFVPLLNGTPDDTVNHWSETDYYYQDMTLFGVEHCEITYTASIIWTQEIVAHIPLEGIDKTALLETVGNNIHEEYKHLKSFFCEEITDDNGELTGYIMGTKLGAPFLNISVYIDKDNSLFIRIMDQQ